MHSLCITQPNSTDWESISSPNFKFTIRKPGTQVHQQNQFPKVPAFPQNIWAGRIPGAATTTSRIRSPKEEPSQPRPLRLHIKDLSWNWPCNPTFPTNTLGHLLISLASDAQVARLLSLPYPNFFLQIRAVFSFSLLVQLPVSTQRSEVAYYCCSRFFPCSYFNCNLMSPNPGEGKDVYN